MPGLQTAYYIIAIVFMGVIFILILALIMTVFMIRAKLNKIEERIQTKVDEATDLAGRSGEILASVGKAAARTAARKIKRSVIGH